MIKDVVVTSSLSIQQNAWSHVSCVLEYQTVSLYVDGEIDKSGTNKHLRAVDCTSGTAPTVGNSINKNTPFVGQLDTLRFWDKALSEAEIVDHLKQGTSAFASESQRDYLDGTSRNRAAESCSVIKEKSTCEKGKSTDSCKDILDESAKANFAKRLGWQKH